VPEGSVVLLRASLRGMNRQAECDVLARKLSQNPLNATSHVGTPAYSECSIISAPADLPDGDYRLIFEGHVVTTRKEHGVWIMLEPVWRARP
jgi:hypothetical protein